MLLRISFLALAGLALAPGASRAAESYDGCTGFIDSLPATISTGGTWCLRKDLATALTTGRAINVTAGFVTIDCNGYKLGNLGGGTATGTYGIYSRNTSGVTVRGCNIRGFYSGIDMVGGTYGGNYVVESNLVQGSRSVGVRLEGPGSTVRGNTVSDTGGSTLVADAPRGIVTGLDVDILDNTVSNVAGLQAAYGIHASQNNGGSITGNRVRGVVPGTGYEAVGIYVATSERMAIRNNDVFATGGTTGIRCPNSKGRARGNIIRGFTTGMYLCADLGLNDQTP